MLDAILARTNLAELDIVLRLTIAVVLGGAIGFDRELKNRPAGLRTHMLTALAAAVFTIVALELVSFAERRGTPADPVRAIEAVTAGVAFLAAGSIIQARGQIVGLTTGAGMWLAGAVGLAAGAGFHSIAVFATVLALVILTGLQRLAQRIGATADPEPGKPIDGSRDAKARKRD